MANSASNSLQPPRNPGKELCPNESSPDTRSRILAAAGPVFAAQGYSGATVREICSMAGVNIASVGYYFGDKLGLYREVIHELRLARAKRFPTPNTDSQRPGDALQALVNTLLARMLNTEEAAWETELLMREMQNPTPVFESIVDDFFRPLFDQLTETLRLLVRSELPAHTLQHLAFSTVGQCLYYRVGAQAIQVLIPEKQRAANYDIQSLSQHITTVMLAACENYAVSHQSIESSDG